MTGHRWTREQIEDVLERYKSENGVYPGQTICDECGYLPTWSTIRRAYKDDWDGFCERFGKTSFKRRVFSVSEYDSLVREFINKCDQLGEPLNSNDVVKYGFPQPMWFVRNCPDSSITTYSQFLEYIGLKPRFELSKEYVENYIRQVYRDKGEPLVATTDFVVSKGSEISTRLIDKYWGSFTQMSEALDIPIKIKKNMKPQTEQELLDNLERLILELGHVPTAKEISDCPYCQYPSSYFKAFDGINNAVTLLGYSPNKVFPSKEMSNEEIFDIYKNKFDELGYALSEPVCRHTEGLPYPATAKRRFNCSWNEFVQMLGYEPNNRYVNAVHTIASDGAKCLSLAERKIHEFMIEHGYEFAKEVGYKTILPDEYSDLAGQKRCDWLIYGKDKLYVVEYFGMMANRQYVEKATLKVNMVNNAGNDYVMIDIYPEDLDRLEEIFSHVE